MIETVMITHRWVLCVARFNRSLLHFWPVFLGRKAIWKTLNRHTRKFGVKLPARTKWGGEFICDLRDIIQSRLYYFGIWEPSLTNFIEKRLKPGDTFVDVGANIGYYTILASKLVGPEGRVVAIEPSPKIYQLLQETLTINHAANVRALNCAAANEHAEVSIFSGPPSNIGATSLIAKRAKEREDSIQTHPLLALLTEIELSAVRLIKIDVEGFELPVLVNLLQNMAQLPHHLEIVVEVSPSSIALLGGSLETLLAEFEIHGMHCYRLHNEYSLVSYFDLSPRPALRERTVPSGQSDIVLSRVDADSLA
jgi:FkbM family methyltransferase